MRNYKKIDAYKIADEVVFEIYQATRSFPKEELYGLTSQLRRAVVSVPANIAEGSSRQHNRDYLNFLYIARGSAAEVEYLLNLSKKLDYINSENFDRANKLICRVAKCLYFLIRSVESELSPHPLSNRRIVPWSHSPIVLSYLKSSLMCATLLGGLVVLVE